MGGVGVRPRPVERVGESEVGTEAYDQTAAGSMALTLRAAAAEGVGSLVTCKLGSFRALPFQAGLFDVALSALKLHQIALVRQRGREGGREGASFKEGGREAGQLPSGCCSS